MIWQRTCDISGTSNLEKTLCINVEVDISGKKKLYLLCSKEEGEVGSSV